MKSLSFSSSTLGFGRVKVNTVNSKVAVLRNAGTELVSITKVDSSSPAFVCTFTGTLFAKFPPRTLLYYDAEGKIHALSGEYYTNSAGKFLLGYVNAFGQLLVILSRLEITSLNDGDPLAMVGSYVNNTWYYANAAGVISTSVTSTFVGIGNSDGNLDLNIILYAISIVSPEDADEIGIDVPFTIAAVTNIQDGKTVTIYAQKEGSTPVSLGTTTTLDGEISKEVTLPSTAFSADDVVTIGLNYESGIVVEDNDVVAKTATITSLSTDPASPTEAEDFTVSCVTAYLEGKTITFEYSTNEVAWTSLGTATSTGGIASIDTANIETAGDYYIRARYNTIVYSNSLSVTVASVETESGILTMDATCVASTPTDG